MSARAQGAAVAFRGRCLTGVMSPVAQAAKLGALLTRGATMAWNELFTSDAGLMSLGVIVFMLGMGVFMYVRFRAFIREESKTKR